MPNIIQNKIDEQPIDVGLLNTMILVWDPTAVQTVDSSGALILTPGGAGSGPGAPILPGKPLWYDNAYFSFWGVTEKLQAGRDVTETWATVLVYWMTSKVYRPGMRIQIARDGRIMVIVGPANVEERSRKQFLIAKAVQ
jgi:hypothetical protein